MLDFIPGPYQSLVRSIGLVIATLGGAAGILSADDLAKIQASFQDIADGIKLIMKGGAALMVVGLPIWGMVKASLKSKVADVKIAAPAALAQAMTQVSPKEMVVAVKDMPEVAGVVTTKDDAGRQLAQSIPSAAVAAAGTPDAKAIAATGATS